MATTYITRTLGTPTNNLKWTLSAWVKRSQTSGDGCIMSIGDNTSDYTRVDFNGNGQIEFDNKPGGSFDGRRMTSAYYRDPAAWYHIVAVFDSANVTGDDRMILYVNGSRITVFGTDIDPSSSAASGNTSAETVRLGVLDTATYFNGEMSWVQFVDGSALAPTEFGEFDSTSGIWKIKTTPYATPGNNGFCLKMEDRTNLDLDSSSNAHTFTTSGTLTATYDNPSNNFATWNPIQRWNADTGSLSNGNTSYTISSNTYNTKSTLAMPGGKWYWEQKASYINADVGVCTAGFNPSIDADSGDAKWGDAGNGGIHVVRATDSTNWQLTNNDTSQNQSTLPGTAIIYVAGDIVMVALDVDNGKMWWGLNGTWFNSGDPAGGTNSIATVANSSPDPFVVIAKMGSATSSTIDINFGNGYFGTTAVTSANADDAGIGAFEYDVPAGFYALCTKNLKLQGG